MSCTHFWFGAFISHWREPVSEGIALLKEGAALGVRVGSPVYAAYNAFFVPIHTRFGGARLDDVHDVIDRYILLMEDQSTHATVPYRQLVRGLMRKSDQSSFQVNTRESGDRLAIDRVDQVAVHNAGQLGGALLRQRRHLVKAM